MVATVSSSFSGGGSSRWPLNQSYTTSRAGFSRLRRLAIITLMCAPGMSAALPVLALR